MDTTKMDDWKKNLVSAMTDDQLGSFQLVGTDNVETSCSKFLLAVQSPVFKKMFFGQFRERDSDRLTVNYHSSINRVIVTYCHSGVLDLSGIWKHDTNNIMTMGEWKQKPNKKKTMEEIKRLVELRDAGRFFELDKILVRAEQDIADSVSSEMFDRNYTAHVCSTVLKEMFAMGESSGAFWGNFFEFAIENPMKCFPVCEMSNQNEEDRPHPQLLTQVLKAISDTDRLIECLQAWSAPHVNNGETETISGIPKQALLEVSGRVDLKTLKPEQLVKLKDCSLFSAEQLLDAFVHHHSSAKKRPASKHKAGLYVHVTGAGVGAANGYFYKYSSTYKKKGQYGGIPCYYEIKRNIGKRWVFSATFKNTGRSIELYQAPPLLSDTRVPLSGWKCIQGTEPTPIIEEQINSIVKNTARWMDYYNPKRKR